MTFRKVCFLGLNYSGLPLGAVIALKCPDIHVYVVQKNPDHTYALHTGRIPPEANAPGLDELLRKTQNKNLFFNANVKTAINESDIIFISSISKLKSVGEGSNRAIDLSMIKNESFLIAEIAENNKVVVEISSIPLKAAECVRSVLKRYGKPNVEFEVISNPGFYEHGSPIQNLLRPDYVLIGSENTPTGLAAIKSITNIYEHWIPTKNIIVLNTWSAELSKIYADAVVMQMYCSMQTIAAICKNSNSDFSFCKDVILRNENFGKGAPQEGFNVERYLFTVRSLVYFFESLNLTKQANYWQGVLDMFSDYPETSLS